MDCATSVPNISGAKKNKRCGGQRSKTTLYSAAASKRPAGLMLTQNMQKIQLHQTAAAASEQFIYVQAKEKRCCRMQRLAGAF